MKLPPPAAMMTIFASITAPVSVVTRQPVSVFSSFSAIWL
jgi:hypothetical protein